MHNTKMDWIKFIKIVNILIRMSRPDYEKPIMRYKENLVKLRDFEDDLWYYSLYKD